MKKYLTQDKKHFLDPLDPEDGRAMKLDQLKKAESGESVCELLKTQMN